MPIFSNYNKCFISDEHFDNLYPASISQLAQSHWTPLDIARDAALYLASLNARVLDIGSGVGKFCLAAAHYAPSAMFFGVEQRQKLIVYAEKAKTQLQVLNVSFIHGNITDIDFNNYDHFYFYNSFFENVDGTDKIDRSIDFSGELFSYYSQHLRQQLAQRPAGTKLVTYHSAEEEVPRDYRLVKSERNNLLKFWVKR